MQGNILRKNDPEYCPVLIDKNDTQDLEKCEDITPDIIKKCEGGTPNIRFRGFKDDWEQRKFGEFYEVNNERNKDLIGYDKTFSIATMTYKNEGNGAADSSLKTYKVLRIGDIAFEGHTNKEFRYGRFVANDVGDGIISPRFSALRPINEMPVSFWKHYIHYEPVMRKKLVCSTKAGTMMNELVTSDFFEQEIAVPCIEEQRQIGTFLNYLDNLITLHQRKCDETKELKKYMLQKMFPKDGEKVPEIRFQGFTGEWEQRRLGELIVKGGSGGTPLSSNSSYYDGTIPFLSITDITKSNGFIYDTEKHISEEGLNSSSAWIVPKEAISLAMYASVGKVAILKENIATSQAFYNMIFEDEHIRNFVSQYLKKMEGNNAWIPYISTGTQANLNSEKVKNLMFLVPKTSNEMQKISDCLFYIDHIITLHQRKCDELKEIKRYMLQNMFPQNR